MAAGNMNGSSRSIMAQLACPFPVCGSASRVAVLGQTPRAAQFELSGGPDVMRRGFEVTAVITTMLISESNTNWLYATLRYSSSDPYAVHADFASADGPARTWVFARDLLVQGLEGDEAAPAGRGDVCIWRDQDPEYLLVTLGGVDGHALIATSAGPVDRFVRATRALVLVDSEADCVGAAVDAFLSSLLAP
ncbi:SsgA family sporulation/cell division regulator [Pengzhenrongella sicca]|uniref:SsgA family sporulation/cell division regulator n=1 Tax=Pengzhenrongella sicca TaxID=2819238 RepID=A0A8A4Z9H8_9MICO|nr:SsgA family sporulation/cell division regulator [Pengzhenrongella sicca]QTE28081.1 SsgA family sporulation/cell division regulator [Pengzhenrongella sicca]